MGKYSSVSPASAPTANSTAGSADRYASWSSGLGAEIEAGKHDFKSLEKHMLAQGDITHNTSGRHEEFENLVNRFVL